MGEDRDAEESGVEEGKGGGKGKGSLRVVRRMMICSMGDMRIHLYVMVPTEST